MRGSLVRRVLVVLAAAATVAIGSSVVLAAIPTSGGTIYACYSKTTGALRVINYPAVRCTSSERILTLQSGSIKSRHLAANFIGHVGDPGWTAMFDFEAAVGPTGTPQSGEYRVDGMTGPNGPWASQGTVDTIRFFTAASGAPAVEITGWECLIAKTTHPDPVGTCGHYRVIVTDGASKGLADTFCGGAADVADPTDPKYCPYVWNVDKGDIRIYSGG